MRREEKTIADRRAIPAFLKKDRVGRLAGFPLNTPVQAPHAS
ncbi:MAG: hypothetical protein V2I40_13080 [Desulfobacteraceae bacterium]|jgi:hypothetical protein|nr:hypothetical protein [Desulfobacteraceae bacterium]